MTGETLTFVHSVTPPTDEIAVYDECTTAFLGTEFRFRVIGSSHYVSAPAYDFYELSSCDPVEKDGATVPLARGEGQRELAFETDSVQGQTVLDHRPLDAFPAGESFDLAYWFGEDAVTAIDLGETGYETYHTYPEYDLTLYSRTRFSRLPDRVVVGSAEHARATRRHE